MVLASMLALLAAITVDFDRMHTRTSIGCTRGSASDGSANFNRMEVAASIRCAAAFQSVALSRFNPLRFCVSIH